MEGVRGFIMAANIENYKSLQNMGSVNFLSLVINNIPQNIPLSVL